MGNKYDRLSAIGAVSEPKVKSLSNAEVVNDDMVIYKIVTELEKVDADRFFDFKYKLVQQYGQCSNKEVFTHMLNIVYANTQNIDPRPEAVRDRETTPKRVATKRYKK